MENYLFLKMLHLLGVVLFLGNVVVTAVWKGLADKTRDARTIAFSQRLVMVTDVIFTSGGAVLIFVTGTLMAEPYGGVHAKSWISWSWWLFMISGVLWAMFLIPIQVMQLKIAKEFVLTNVIPNKYWVLSRWWMGIGFFATTIPMMNLYFMVYKPV